MSEPHGDPAPQPGGTPSSGQEGEPAGGPAPQAGGAPNPPGGGYTPPPPPPPPPPAPPYGGGYGPPPPPPSGYTPPPQAGYPPTQGYGGYGSYGYAAQRNDGLAIASLVIGLLSLPCSLFCLGLVLGPTAAIMGFISRQRIASSGGMVGGGGFALAGMILGILGFVVSVGWFFFFVATAINNQGAATPSP